MRQIVRFLGGGLLAVCMSFSSARGADYTIDAALDVDTKTISGEARVSWVNSSALEVPDLRFHLYFNAWRDGKSSFLRSSRFDGERLSEWREGEWGGNEIEALTATCFGTAGDTAWEVELTERMEFIQPDDGNPHDRTVMRVALPAPVPPGARLDIRMRFTTKVPRPFARVGYRGDYYFLAHWFPKLGVLEPDGTWNCHQFIQTEFYSEFGTYQVSLKVPTGWVVGATGREVSRTDEPNGLTNHVFRQERVHEFAWTASPHFSVFNRRFEHPGLPPVDIRLLVMPDHLGQEDRYFAATEAALRYYGEWFGPYDYGHVTVVDPAFRSRSGGMEYPTLFTGGSRWLNPDYSGSPEGVTVHECGHQFWYGILANNEFEDAWLDEGFNTYSTGRVMGVAFPETFTVRRYVDGFFPVLFRDLPESPRSVSGLGGYYSPLKLDVLARPSWTYSQPAALESGNRLGRLSRQGSYVLNSYTKPALLLKTLENHLGWELFQKVLSTYFERFRRKSPKPQDFLKTVHEVSGQNLEWFWKETLESSNVFDYAVDSVETSEDLQRVIVRRWGEAVFPVQIRITFSNGDVVDRRWEGRDRWLGLTFQRPEEIESVLVDPDQILALEVNRTNNSWVRNAPTGRAAAKWGLKWGYWLQNALEFFAFFG